MFSPPLNSGPSAQQSQPPQSNLTASAPAQNLAPPPAETVQRSNTVGARGRRLSDSGKKRGVSPVSLTLSFPVIADDQMGERILRDHGHF